MEQRTFKEEYLEILWYMKEDGNASLPYFKEELGDNFNPEVLKEIVAEGIVQLEDERISLTEKGHQYTRQLIRSHRLAERLVHDVLGVEFEKGACEFEHILNHDLVDSICTLLGHPRECPHGMPIPEGECCERSEKTIASSVVYLSELSVGETRQIAYVNCQNDAQVHRLNGLQLQPGVSIKLHQKYPSFVVECEGGMIAIDEKIAGSICLWEEPERNHLAPRTAIGAHGGGRMRRRRWRRG